ncbi:unnamed protein product [Urochloa decumbens]|uniref:PGG domain-containing protein n=1 Tax=Urochloa decumbens TaxID=240449 RepID=A0ABC9B2V4_9POAL
MADQVASQVLELAHMDSAMSNTSSALASAANVVSEVPLITRSRSSSSRGALMDGGLLEAATSGDAKSMKQQLALHDPAVLFRTTPQGNTCLHIASIHGHEEFCKNVLTLENSQELLSAVNGDGETPLLTAVARGHRELALELIEEKPALSKHVNKYDESPMFMAAIRNFTDVVKKLLNISDAARTGPFGFNALHAAVRNSNPEIAKAIIARHLPLMRQENNNHLTPIHLAVSDGNVEMVSAMLEQDQSLGYLSYESGSPLLCVAASKGHVGIAQQLLKHCPDAPYCDATGSTCLHEAVLSGQAEFVEFIMASQQLRQLVNMLNGERETALHLAVKKSDKIHKKMVAALRLHQDIDDTVLNGNGITVLQDGVHKIAAGPVITGPLPGEPGMDDRRLQVLEAATSGNGDLLRHLFRLDPVLLLSRNPHGNTCLHIASMHGHERFCKDAIAMNSSLLAAVNIDDETPLLIAVTSGHVALASALLVCCHEEEQLGRAILKQDKQGCNALHHAIRSGHGKLALELIEEEPGLSQAWNNSNESPMFMAVRRDLTVVFEKLLGIPFSAHCGTRGYNVLHAAVGNGNPDMVKRIMVARPWLAREEDLSWKTPVHTAAYENKIDILGLFLEEDRSLGYLNPTSGDPLLCTAAFVGHVGIAQELLKHCRDAPFRTRANGWTCLHTAVYHDQMEFAKFVLRSQKLRKLINMQDKSGETALHLAVRKCNPKMVDALLHHRDIDITVLSRSGQTATWVLFNTSDEAKTLNWNEVYMLMLKADPKIATSTDNLHGAVMDEVTNALRKDAKALTEKYTNNTSLVAILIATITFAAAFTLPGGYSSNAYNEGYPIMARKVAFQAFLISDTLAMCSSLAVAFICIIAKWEDFEFLLHYRSFTKKLMWFAYMGTTIAFSTGLYTVLAPRLLWLAVAVCVPTVLLPIFTMLLGEWPIWKLRIQLRQNFKSGLLDMV